jgi:glycyl-tRNA synthetase
LAYRTDYDLSQHAAGSKVDLSYFDEETKERFVPHCIEPSLGVGRTILAAICSAYTEDELGGEKRVYLKLSPKIAPYVVSIMPLLKNKEELTSKAKEIFANLKKTNLLSGKVFYDETGSIGKRYRRQDEIGTPFCVTIDFDTIGKGEDASLTDTVTIRDRDTGNQERISLAELDKYLQDKII